MNATQPESDRTVGIGDKFYHHARVGGGTVKVLKPGVAWNDVTRADLGPAEADPADAEEATRWCALFDNLWECEKDTAVVLFLDPVSGDPMMQAIDGPEHDHPVAIRVVARNLSAVPREPDTRVVPLKSVSPRQRPVAANDNQPIWPGIVSSGDFVRGFVPPDYHIDGIVQSGFVYSVTASSGTGKTAILLLITALTALGGSLGDHEIRKGRAIYFAGENPSDVTMRWIAQAHLMGFDADEIDVYFVPGVFDIKGMFNEVAKGVDALGGADLIIVDTSAAYFMGQDENGNVDMGKHARDLRGLTTVAGGPCVLVACHPTKSADQSNLLPRGGGAFIAEMDGNLTCAKVGDGNVKLHWQGKHRGPDFEPVVFEMQTVTAPALKDSKGRDVPTVMASVMSDGDVKAKKQSARNDEDEAILRLEQGATSTTQVADAAGWRDKAGNPHKRRAQSALDKLRKGKLAEYVERKGWKLTKAGDEAAVDVRTDRHRAAVGTAVLARLTGSD